MSPWIPVALKELWNLGNQWLSNKKEVKAAKHERQLEDIKQGKALIDQASLSWKDEYWTLVLSMPMVQLMLAPVVELAMSPYPYIAGQWQEAVVEGLKALGSTPEWYQMSVWASIAFSFGIKPVLNKFKK